MTVICPSCHLETVEGAKFCPKCGTPMGASVGGATVATAAPSVSAAGGSSTTLAPRDIGGRYRIFEKLGEGAMGAVYRGEQISLKRPVAVKVLKAELSTDRTLVRRFNAEAEAVAKLGHPNTVNIHDFGQDADGSLFIVMELVEGKTLRATIQAEGPMSPSRTLTIASQIAASLSDAHARSIVHRDLKPDNVMLQARGRYRDIVRVLDFGIAKLREDNRATMVAMTQAGDLLGTPQYMAPEQIMGNAIDGRADIYALGCMIYEMVTGRRAFDATSIPELLTKHLTEAVEPPSARRPDLKIPPELDRLVLMAMMKQPVARPATMDLYGEQIAAVLAALPRDANQGPSPIGYAPGSVAVPAISPYQTPPAALPAVSPSPTPPLPMSAAASASGGLQPTSPASTPSGLQPTSPASTPSGISAFQTPPGQQQMYGAVAPRTQRGSAAPLGAATPVPTPPLGAAASSPTPQGPITPYPPTQVISSQTPSSGLPPAVSTTTAKSGASSTVDIVHSSRAPLYILIGVLVAALGGVGIYLGTRKPSTTTVAKTDPQDPPSANPTTNPTTNPTNPTTNPSNGSSTVPTTIDAGAGAPLAGTGPGSSAAPVQRPPGDLVNAAQGFKLVVPPGFKVSRQGQNLYAQNGTYTIAIGPITSKKLDPKTAAEDYAQQTGLTFDGIGEKKLAGAIRTGAAFHGTLYEQEVAQSIISYTGAKYRIAVSLTMPNEARNDTDVRAFADELFDKRVIPPP